MTRRHRRAHVLAWLVLGPVALGLVALSIFRGPSRPHGPDAPADRRTSR